jgi:hypothetical protein
LLRIALPIAALAAVLAAFRPWFEVRFLSSDGTTQTNTADAWAASTWWSAGLVLTAVAALVGYWALRAERPPKWALATASAVALAGSALLAVQWWDLGPGAGHRFRTTAIQIAPLTPDQLADLLGRIQRNQLEVTSEAGYHSGPTWTAATSSVGVAAFTLWMVAMAGMSLGAGEGRST